MLISEKVHMCAFCKHWYDPCNSAIELGIARGKWNVDMEKKNKCLVKNVFLRANHPACKDYEHKL